VTRGYGNRPRFVGSFTRVALHAKTPLFAEGRTLAIEEYKHALESWR